VRTSITLIKPELNAIIDPKKLIFIPPSWEVPGNSE
jgi:hypothetical protein